MFKNQVHFLVLFGLLLLSFGCVSPPQSHDVPNNPNPPNPSNSNTNQPLPQEPTQTQPSSSSEVSFISDGWQIYGDLHQSSTTPTKVIVLSHMYSHNRSDYPSSFIAKLQQQIPDAVVMAIDLRGHGKSTNKGHDIDLSTDDIANMKNDVVAAKNFAKSRYPSINRGYVVGASIGSTASILAAASDRDFTKAALLSPAFGYRDVNTRPSLESFSGKLLLVSSNNDDPDSRYSVDEMSSVAGASSKQIKMYQEGHGSEIFGLEGSERPLLDDLIVDFLKND